jgi:hypothetical protein
MSPVLVTSIVLVSVALIAAIVREYRFLSQSEPGSSSRLLHGLRILGAMALGLGVIGRILDAAGYGGTGPTVEVERWHPAFGTTVTSYAEGPSRLAQLSSWAAIVGLGLWGVCSFFLSQFQQRNRTSRKARA